MVYLHYLTYYICINYINVFTYLYTNTKNTLIAPQIKYDFLQNNNTQALIFLVFFLNKFIWAYSKKGTRVSPIQSQNHTRIQKANALGIFTATEGVTQTSEL